MFDSANDPHTTQLFCSAISDNLRGSLANSRGFYDVQVLITELIRNFLGTGILDKGAVKHDSDNNIRNFNTHFFIPPLVGKYLGVNGAKAAKDVYHYIFGIQKYSGSP